MNIQSEDINETRKKITATISGDEIASAEKELLAEFAKSAKIQGFRPGKAPLNLIKGRYKKELAEELKRKLTGQAYQDAIKDLHVMSVVSVDEADFVPGQDAVVTFTFDLRPAFELPDYKGLPVTVPSTEATDEEFERTKEYILNQRAEYNVAEKAAEVGDYVKLDYAGTVDGQPVGELVPGNAMYGDQTNTWEEAGSEDAPGVRCIIDGIVGMKAGDEKNVEQTFADDFQVEALRGKTAKYHVKVHEVREKKMPEMNAEFLKGFNVETEEAFIQSIKDDIKSQKENQANGQKREQVIQQLSGKVEFPLPESIVENETQYVLRDFMARNMAQGAKEEDFEERKDELFAGASKAARDRIKAQLLLSAVAEKEGIKVEQDDIQQAIMQQAMQSRRKPEDIVKELQADRQRVAQLQQNVLHNKALDFLVSQATVTVGEAPHVCDEHCEHDHEHEHSHA